MSSPNSGDTPYHTPATTPPQQSPQQEPIVSALTRELQKARDSIQEDFQGGLADPRHREALKQEQDKLVAALDEAIADGEGEELFQKIISDASARRDSWVKRLETLQAHVEFAEKAHDQAIVARDLLMAARPELFSTGRDEFDTPATPANTPVKHLLSTPTKPPTTKRPAPGTPRFPPPFLAPATPSSPTPSRQNAFYHVTHETPKNMTTTTPKGASVLDFSTLSKKVIPAPPKSASPTKPADPAFRVHRTKETPASPSNNIENYEAWVVYAANGKHGVFKSWAHSSGGAESILLGVKKVEWLIKKYVHYETAEAYYQEAGDAGILTMLANPSFKDEVFIVLQGVEPGVYTKRFELMSRGLNWRGGVVQHGKGKKDEAEALFRSYLINSPSKVRRLIRDGPRD